MLMGKKTRKERRKRRSCPFTFDLYANQTSGGSDVMKKLNESRKTNPEFCDLIITIGCDNFYCHKFVLVELVPYFNRMWMTNCTIKDGRPVITLDNMDANSFGILLECFYTGQLKLPPNDITSVLYLLPITDYLGLSHVREICLLTIKTMLKTVNSDVFDLCTFMISYKNDEVYKIAYEFIVNNFRTLYNSEYFPSLPYCIFKDLLNDESIFRLLKTEVLDVIFKWITHDPDRLQYLDELIDAVRLPDSSMFVVEEKNDAANTKIMIDKIRSLKRQNDDSRQRETVAGSAPKSGEGIFFFYPSAVGSSRGISKGECQVKETKETVVDVVRYNGRFFEFVPRLTDVFPFSCSGTDLKTADVSQQTVTMDSQLYSYTYCSRRDQRFFRYFDRYDERWGKLCEPFCGVSSHCMVAVNHTRCIYLNFSPKNKFANLKMMGYVAQRDKWEMLPKYLDPVAAAGITVHGNGTLYAIGGIDIKSQVPVMLCGRYDSRAGHWDPITSLPKKRAYVATACLNDKIYVTGGADRHYLENDIHSYKSGFVYDVRADKWLPIPSMTDPMHCHRLAFFQNDLWAVRADCKMNKFSFSDNVWSADVGNISDHIDINRILSTTVGP